MIKEYFLNYEAMNSDVTINLSRLHHGFFYAMDTYREYLVLNELWSQDKVPWRILQ